MNCKEEQINELEALSEIYYNEIKVISDKPPISFSIKIRPQASNYEEIETNDSAGEDENDSDEADLNDDDSVGDIAATQQQGLCVEILFRLPPRYPEEKPSIEIIDSLSLEEDDLAELLDKLNQKADESLGTVMVFILVSDVVEWLIEKSEQEVNQLELEKEQKQKEVEAEEKKRFEGTPVTEQTFLAWKARFDAEMIKAKIDQQKQRSELGPESSSRRLTGRAMFESQPTLAESDLNFVEELDQSQLEALLHNIEEIDIEAGDDDDEFELEEGDDSEYEESEEEVEQENSKKHKNSSKK